MRFLLFTQYFPPEPIGKFADLAERLADRGHQVEVITGNPCYPQGKTYAGYRQRFVREQLRANLTVFRAPQWPDHSTSALKRARYYMSYAFSAAWCALRHASHPDVVVAYQSAMPAGYAAWLASRRYGSKLVLDVVDLWPDSLEAAGVRNSFVLGAIRRNIRFLYGAADRINVITTGYREKLTALGVDANKIAQVYQWPPRDAIAATSPEFVARPREMEGQNFHVVYAGAIGPCQDLGVILEAAKRLGASSRVHWWVLGEGTERQRLLKEASRLQLDKVHFLGQRPAKEAAAWLAGSDCLLLHLQPSEMARVSIPSKTFAYLAAGKPLLCGVAGETAEVVSLAGCGELFTPGDGDSLATKAERLSSLTPRDLEERGQCGRRAYLDKFSAEGLLEQMVSLLESTGNSPEVLADSSRRWRAAA